MYGKIYAKNKESPPDSSVAKGEIVCNSNIAAQEREKDNQQMLARRWIT